MPCSSPGVNDEVAFEREKKYREESDKLTAMLCSLCRLVDEHNDGIDFVHAAGRIIPSRAVQQWWKTHKQWDKERKKKRRRK